MANFYTRITALLDGPPPGLVTVKQFTNNLKKSEGRPGEFGSEHYQKLPEGTLVGRFDGKGEKELDKWLKSEDGQKYDGYEATYHNASGYGDTGEYWFLPKGKSIPGNIPQGQRRAFTIKKLG